MIAQTKVYNKYQTVIPAEIRKIVGNDKMEIIEWDINEDMQVILNFRKKRN